MRAQRQRDAVVQQRQIDRLGLVQHAGEIEHRRGQPVGRRGDRRLGRTGGADRSDRGRQIAAAVLPHKAVVELLRLLAVALPLLEIGDDFGHSPVQLIVLADRLLVKLPRLVRLAGKIVQQPELKDFQRLEAVELVEPLQRRFGAGQIAGRHAGPGERERGDETVHAVGRQRRGRLDRAGRSPDFSRSTTLTRWATASLGSRFSSLRARVAARSKFPVNTSIRNVRLISSGESGSSASAFS